MVTAEGSEASVTHALLSCLDLCGVLLPEQVVAHNAPS